MRQLDLVLLGRHRQHVFLAGQLGGEHLVGSPVGADRAAGEDADAVGVRRRQAQVVQHDHHGATGAREVAGDRQHGLLVPDVEGGRGLVEQHHRGVLRQHAGQVGAGALATGERGVAAPGQVHDVRALQRLVDETLVVVLVAGARPRGTPHRDDLADEEPEGQPPLLREHGALLIFDEMITGFRFALGGAQELFGVTPDLATFGKGMANGMPISAIVGRADIMAEMEEIFFSATFGGEALSLAAAIATIDKIRREPVIETLWRNGKHLAGAVNELISKHRLSNQIGLQGMAPWTLVSVTGDSESDGRAIKTMLIYELAARGVRRPLIITDTGLVEHGVVEKLLAALPGNPDVAVYDGIPPNPTVAGIEGALAIYREQDCDGVVALGGGSVLDSGKALRVAVTHAEPIIEYLKDPSKITADVAPYITLPTTAGTGAEITFGGGIHPAPGEHQLGIRSPHVRPDLAICDPDLTLTLPPTLTAATGMDALAHCVEGYLSRNVNPPVEAIALDGRPR